MKKICTYFFSVLLTLIFANPIQAQFYDVQKKKRVAVVNTRGEISGELDLGRVENGKMKAESYNSRGKASTLGDDKDGRLKEEIRLALLELLGVDATSGEGLGDRSRANNRGKQLSENKISEGEVVDSLGQATEPSLLCSPLKHLYVTSSYGYRIHPITQKRHFHAGTDFRTASENVYAMMPGRIRKIGYDKMLGNYIELDHGDFRVTYAHLHTVVGEKGDYVKAGQSVGISGSTGRSTGDHLHVSMRYKKKLVDPYPLLRYIADFSQHLLEEDVENNTIAAVE